MRTIEATQHALSEKKTTLHAVLKHYHQAIKQQHPLLKSITHTLHPINQQQWFTQQHVYAEQPEQFPLLGAMVSIKDNLHIRTVATTAGSRLLQHFLAPFHATAVEKLVHHGAFIVAKTNMDPFGMGTKSANLIHGATRNPWCWTRSAGGSSGGAAASVAAGLCHAALGSDTGGSIRQPAAWCGVCGLRPTYGSVSRHGMVALDTSMDQIGPLTHTAYDAACIMNALAGPDPVYDSTAQPRRITDYRARLNMPLKGLRIGSFTGWDACAQAGSPVHPDIRAAYEQLLQWLLTQGAVCTAVPCENLQASFAAYRTLNAVAAYSNLARYDGLRYGGPPPAEADTWSSQITRVRSTLMEACVQERVLWGAHLLYGPQEQHLHQRAQQHQMHLHQHFKQVFQEVDLILTPSTPHTARLCDDDHPNEVRDGSNSDLFLTSASLTGLPALSFPIGFDHQALPIGAQAIGPAWSDDRLLQLAHQYEQAHDWHQRQPPTYPQKAPV